MAWAPDYITTAQLAAYLRITDALDDTELAVCTGGASRAIDFHCNRQFGLVAAESRSYVARYDYERCTWVVDVDDFMSAVGLVVTIGGTATTAFTKEPLNAAATGRPWTRLRLDYAAAVVPVTPTYTVDVVAPWGWSAVPSAVTLAARIQGGRFHIRRDALFGVAGSPETGSELRLLDRVDPDVGVSLRDFVRPRRPS